MVLPDNETKVDLLNNEPMAKTIVDLLKEREEQPLTVGVHGDWGAGKSSILEMIEHAFAGDEERLCLKFNGWRFQGFEDAKIALIEGIVTELIKRRSLATKATVAVKEIFHRIDVLKAAKKMGSLAFTVATGLPSPDMITGVVDTLKGFASDPGSVANKENLDAAIGHVEDLIKPAEGRNVPEEIEAFRKSFAELLKLAKVKQLVVLIDDLDRCLPDTAIETLEAVRLFVFMPHTAFVVAADEAMIGYAVRKHFPDLPETTGPRDYARNYLEKLIQVPFRIPSLGQTETRIYVTLLFVSAELGEADARFTKLVEVAKDRLKRPWEALPLEAKVIRDALQGKESAANHAIALSDQIGGILAQGTQGNPRQIKRFLNTLILRQRMAAARGFGEAVELAILAKLMLAERFMTRTFEQIAAAAGPNPQGQCEALAQLEAALDEEAKPAAPRKPGSEIHNAMEASPLLAEWQASGEVKAWARIEPRLANVDLRPYLFVTKDRKDYLAATSILGPLQLVVDRLMGTRISVQTMGAELRQLTGEEASKVFEGVRSRISGAASFELPPPGVDGITALVKAQPALQTNLLDMLEMLPTDKCGPWPVQGWEGVVVDASAKARLDALLERWEGAKSTTLRMAAAAVRKTPKPR